MEIDPQQYRLIISALVSTGRPDLAVDVHRHLNACGVCPVKSFPAPNEAGQDPADNPPD